MHFTGLCGNLLIHPSGHITKRACVGLRRNQTEAQLIADNDHPGTRSAHRLKKRAGAGDDILFIETDPDQIAQPQCHAVEQNRSILRSILGNPGLHVNRLFNRCPIPCACRLVPRNPRSHFFIQSLSRCDKRAGPGCTGQPEGRLAFTRRCPTQHQEDAPLGSAGRLTLSQLSW